MNASISDFDSLDSVGRMSDEEVIERNVLSLSLPQDSSLAVHRTDFEPEQHI